jgi:hypothetical protein
VAAIYSLLCGDAVTENGHYDRLGSGAAAANIRDTLRAADPLLEDIDRRNMLYARSSVERVKALLEPDSTLAGKLAALVKEIYRQGKAAAKETDGGLHQRLAHRLHRIRGGGDTWLRLGREETCALLTARLLYEEKRTELSLGRDGRDELLASLSRKEKSGPDQGAEGG